MKPTNQYFITCPDCGHVQFYESEKYHSGQHLCMNCNGWLMSDEIPEAMKAVSIRNPWAYLICSGIKPIENRTWPTKFRGRVLIHAGAKYISMINHNNIFTHNQWESLSTDQKVHLIGGYIPRSAIIGSVEIIDCVQNDPSIWAEKGVWNWVLANSVLFEKPILNVKGKLSFFYPKID